LACPGPENFANKAKKMYNVRMIKKICSIFLILVLVISSVSCSAIGVGSGAATLGYGFAEAIANRDYSAAYGYIYEHSAGKGTEEEFAARYNNILGALQVTDIKLTSREVVENGEMFTLKYTLAMKSKLMGDIQYDYQADITPTINGYGVMYTPSLILPFLETGDTVRIKTEYGKRGEIFDKNKEVLAKNDYAQSVYLEIAKIQDINTAAATVSSVLGIDAADILEKYNNAVENKFDLAVIKALPKNTLTQEQKDALTAVPGVQIDEDSLTPLRYYPMQDSFAHSVGYMGSPSDDEVAEMADKGITQDSKIGKTGLEAIYEDQLRPSDGYKIYVQDSLGNEKKVLFEQPKQDGEDIVTTLDARIQNKAYSLLATNLKEDQSGAVVVLDYKTGNVEALVSYPSFDPNYFSFPMDNKLWSYLNSEEAQTPLFFRATQAVLPPGSSFKPFSIVPALEGGKLTPETVPDINKDIVNNEWMPHVEGWVYPSIKRAHATLGEFNMMNAMKSSDNIFYAWAAMQVGIEPFMEYMHKIGMGEVPSFELPIKKSNLLNEGTEMNIKILADMGYGMAEILVSPLQLASMYTAIMNNGDMLNPTIVDSIYQTQGTAYNKVYQNQRTIFKQGVMQQSTIDILKEALHMVVESGTAYQSRLPGVNLIGKTGTAQVSQADGNKKEVNWLILINEDESNPKLTLVMLDTLKDEGDARYFIGRELMKPEGYVDPEETTEPETTEQPETTQTNEPETSQ
jgi:cell division protein FtsI/penicillin-binding protein 2